MIKLIKAILANKKIKKSETLPKNSFELYLKVRKAKLDK